MTSLPDPLVPAGVDLRDFPYVPIFRARLFGSSFHARSSDAEWRAGVTLWLKSWDQVPAGSLPNDEIDLCRLAELGRDLSTWSSIRDGAMRGWVLCSDGRLYHETVSEGILDADAKRSKARKKGLAGAQARWAQSNAQASNSNGTGTAQALSRDSRSNPPRNAHASTSDGTSTAQAVARAMPGNGKRSEGEGEGEEKGVDEHAQPPSGGSSPAPDDRPPLALVAVPPSAPPPCPHQRILDAYHRVLPTLPRVREWSETRRSHLAARWGYRAKRQSVEWWENLFIFIADSPFLLGQRPGRDGTPPFELTLPWLVKSEENLLKVIEGNFHRDVA